MSFSLFSHAVPLLSPLDIDAVDGCVKAFYFILNFSVESIFFKLHS